MGASTRALLARFVGLAVGAGLIAPVPPVAGDSAAAAPRFRCAGQLNPSGPVPASPPRRRPSQRSCR